MITQKYEIHMKGNLFQQVKFIGTYWQRGTLTFIKWDKALIKDFVYEDSKLFGFIPWQKRSVGWVDGSEPDTPNPYVVPTCDIALISKVR